MSSDEEEAVLSRWRDVIDRSGLAVLLIQLSTQQIVASSAVAKELLGPVTRPEDLMIDVDAAHKRLALLAAGVINGYRVRAKFATVSKAQGSALFDVQRAETPGAEDLVVVIVTPDRESTATNLSDELANLCKGYPPSELERPVLLGTVDSDWQIARVSADVAEVLGYKPDEVIGTAFTKLVDPYDVGNLLIGIGQSFESSESVTIRVRMKHANGEWCPFSVDVVPLVGPEVSEFAFVARPVGGAEGESATTNASARAADLEYRLWRIALEVKAAGIVQDLRRLPNLTRVRGINELSARQLEVLTRLLDGQRVPAIAKEMFVSQSTVRNHLGAIYRKLEVHSQSELLTLVRDPGEAPDPPKPSP